MPTEQHPPYRSAAAMAARMEPGPIRHRWALKRTLDNWRNARSLLERGIGLWG